VTSAPDLSPFEFLSHINLLTIIVFELKFPINYICISNCDLIYFVYKRNIIMDITVKLFKALSDQSRLRILKALQSKTLCVCEIREMLNLANSTVSEHLRILKDTGFIVEEKDGKWVNYSIHPNPGDSRIVAILTRLDFWIDDDKAINKDKKLLKIIDRGLLCCKN
jgi:ArsR family transcriptional regulator